jgi:hypothetical protein
VRATPSQSLVYARASAKLWPPQVQVAAWVPFEPTAFQSAGRQYLIYELYLTNFEDHTLRVDSIEAIDATRATTKPAASFEAPQLNTMMHHVGQPIVGDEIGSAEDNSQRDIAAGQTSILYLLVKSEEHAQIPARLVHRLIIGGSTVEAAAISTHHEQVHVIGPPLKGGPWVADSGPGNESHHRRQILVLEGSLHISSRFAIDWLRLKNSEASSGNKQDNRSYFSYGEPVLAVSDAKVTMVIEKVSGLTYTDYVKRYLLDPAGLKTAQFGDSWSIIPGRAELYTNLDITSDHKWLLLRDGKPVYLKTGILRYGHKIWEPCQNRSSKTSSGYIVPSLNDHRFAFEKAAGLTSMRLLRDGGVDVGAEFGDAAV